jgi:phage N-6-adenine-methyltransferase
MLESTLITYTREIALAHQEIQAASKNIIEKACEIGRKLSTLKEHHIKHGQWLPYLKRNLPELHERVAQKYMLVFNHQDKWKTKYDSESDLTLEGVLNLITGTGKKTKKDREIKCPLKRAKQAYRQLPESYRKSFFEYVGNPQGFNTIQAARRYDSDSWGTPKHVIDLVKMVLGEIELDPASSDKHQSRRIQAKRFFSKADDGLKQKWIAKTLFVNPPFSNNKTWVPKALHEFKCGHVQEMILLVPNDTKPVWWHSTFKAMHAVCITKGALALHDPRDDVARRSPMGFHLFYFGPKPDKFVRVFAELGTIFRNPLKGADHHDYATIESRAIIIPDVDNSRGKIKSQNGRASEQVKLMSCEGVAR